MRILALMLIVAFSALSLGPPTVEAATSLTANDIDQGVTDQLDSALLVNDGNHGGNGRSIDLGPPATRMFAFDKNNNIRPLGNNIGLLDKFGVGVNTTAIMTFWPDMRNKFSINHAAVLKAGPRHHSE